jgi:hypothetical protein
MKALSLGVTILLAHAAAAQGRERVVVAVFKTIGGALTDPARQQQARVSLLGGLAASSFEVVQPAELSRALAGAPELADCDTAACLKRIGELTNARWVVRSSLESVGANWLIQIELIDAHDSTTAARADETCDVCNVTDVNEKLSNAAASLRGKLPQAPKPPVPPPPPPPPPHDARMWRILGIAGVAAGAVGLIAGIALIAIDHSEFGTRKDSNNLLIEQRYSTLAPGIVLTIAGLGAAGGGAWALWHDAKLHRAVTVTPSAGPTGAGVLFDARF